MVFSVSIGVRVILNKPAITDPPAALIMTGKFLVYSKLSISVRKRVLANVSPNLDAGPWISAGAIPKNIFKIKRLPL